MAFHDWEMGVSGHKLSQLSELLYTFFYFWGLFFKKNINLLMENDIKKYFKGINTHGMINTSIYGD